MNVGSKAQPFGRYQLVARISTSGVSEIWRARAVGAAGFERSLAVKKIHPHLTGSRRFVERLTQEAARAATLSHANIIHLTDFDQVGGVYYVALELVEGIDLRQALRASLEARRPLSVSQSAYIACEVLRALTYAHERPGGAVLHRDLTPSSVLISHHGEVRLTGFGIGEIALLEPERGMLPSKLPYLPPEQLDRAPLDHRADLFMLGAVLYEMLTGAPCFAGKDDADTVQRVRTLRPPPPSSVNPEVPPVLDQLTLRLLEKEVSKRPATAREALRIMLDLLHERVTEYQALDLASFLTELGSGAPALPRTDRVTHQKEAAAPFVAAHASAKTGELPIVRAKTPAWVWAALGGVVVALVLLALLLL